MTSSHRNVSIQTSSSTCARTQSLTVRDLRTTLNEVRAVVKDLLVDAVEATKDSRSQLTVLVGLWRDSENAEDEKSKRKASGLAEVEMELPLDDGILDDLHARFAARYKFSLKETEVLWAHLLGRLKREFDRKTHSLIHLTRVGSEREAGRSVAAKSVRLGERVVGSFGESHGA